jgi:hypothetical protein
MLILQEATGKTPLLLAAARGDSEVVEALLDAGSDIEARDRDGRTSLYIAVRKLIDSGKVDMDMFDNMREYRRGVAYPHRPLAAQSAPDVVCMLVNRGAQVDAKQVRRPVRPSCMHHCWSRSHATSPNPCLRTTAPRPCPSSWSVIMIIQKLVQFTL